MSLEECKADLEKINALTHGDIIAVALLFSELAGEPIPPPAVCEMVGVEAKPGASCTVEQFLAGFSKLPPTPETKVIVAKHANSHVILKEIAPKLGKLHEKCAGDYGAIKSWMCEVAGADLPDELLTAFFECEVGAKIDFGQLMNGVGRAIDHTDKVETFDRALDKHLAM
mmetsp:Transcript_36050/g.82087  ORF Transcript_36050/g.82087 Transcript_36050/m.82087 type:complete len:170 (+) Transcript_36050:43-552(+)